MSASSSWHAAIQMQHAMTLPTAIDVSATEASKAMVPWHVLRRVLSIVLMVTVRRPLIFSASAIWAGQGHAVTSTVGATITVVVSREWGIVISATTSPRETTATCAGKGASGMLPVLLAAESAPAMNMVIPHEACATQQQGTATACTTPVGNIASLASQGTLVILGMEAAAS